MENKTKAAKKYHRIKNWLLLINILLALSALLLFLFLGLSQALKDKILEFSQNNFLLVAIYVFILSLGYFIISFPLNFYEGYRLEHRFKLSHQRFHQWLIDLFKRQAIDLVILLIIIEAIYIFLKNAQDNWWLYVAIFWIFISIILAKITPNIIIPLFFKSSPIKDKNLKVKILSLVEKAGSTIKNVFIINFSRKTKKANALVCGLGENRRILLADNLVNEFSHDEIATVVAHELGHEIHKDTIRLLIFGSIFSFLSFFICDVFLKSTVALFGFREIGDIAAFPLLAICLFAVSLFILPLQNGYTRRRERIADLFALGLTRDVPSFILMMEKLGEKNLADFSPNKAIEFLLYDHPPIARRINYATKFNIGEERRRYVRLDTVLPVEFQISLMAPTGSEIISSWQQGFSQDVSYGGICLKVNFLKQDITHLDIDKIKIFLNMHLPVRRQPICVQARCAWMKKLPEGKDSYVLGLNFETIRRKDRQALLRYARWRKILPRLAFALLAILLIAFLVIFTYNLKLRLKNQKLIDNLTDVSEKLSLTRINIREIDVERETLNNQIFDLKAKIKMLNRELSEIELREREEILKYQQQMIDEEVVHQKDIDTLKAKLDKLGEEKKNLENKLASLARDREKATSIIINTEKIKLSMEKETIEKMYVWIKARQNPNTGLIRSFEGDDAIEDWAFTYDQSLAALVFMLLDDYGRARKIFDFYKKISLQENAFVNAYYASGGEAAEYVVHAGPNIWLGIAVLHYIHNTGDMHYLSLVEHIAKWLMGLQAEDKDGGIRGGYGVDWYATEHNLDAYAFFDMLHKITKEAKYFKSRDKVLSWLKINAYNKGSVPIWRGRGDSTIATDTYFWSIAALGPERLKSIDMDPDKIIKFAEDNCYVSVEFDKPDYGRIKISGFDFAKKRHLPRGGIVSSEFTAQVVVSYKIMFAYHKNNNHIDKASIYEQKADDLLNELSKMVILSISAVGQSYPCLPYATQENADTGHGWFTPKGRQTGSLSGTAYTIFAYYGYNPLAFRDEEKKS